MNDDRLTHQLLDAAEYCLEKGNRHINEVILQQIHQPCEGKYCKKCNGCKCHMGGTVYYPSIMDSLESIRARFPDVFDEQCSGCEGCFLDIQVVEEELDRDSVPHSIPESFQYLSQYIMDTKDSELTITITHDWNASVEYYIARKGEGLRERLMKANCSDAAIFGGYANSDCIFADLFMQMDGWRSNKAEVRKLLPAFSRCPKKCDRCGVIIALFHD